MEYLSRTKTKRKHSIVETAYKLFLENGIASTSMNDIATTCNITRRTIYNYFETKTDLLYYLMNKASEEIKPDFEEEYDENKTGYENLDAKLETVFDCYFKHMAKFKFLTQARIYLSYQENYGEEIKNQPNENDRMIANDFSKIIKAGVADKSINTHEMNENELSDVIYDSVFGFLFNATIQSKKLDLDAYKKRCKNYKMILMEFAK